MMYKKLNNFDMTLVFDLHIRDVGYESQYHNVLQADHLCYPLEQ